jgi:hypothetical protein
MPVEVISPKVDGLFSVQESPKEEAGLASLTMLLWQDALTPALMPAPFLGIQNPAKLSLLFEADFYPLPTILLEL